MPVVAPRREGRSAPQGPATPQPPPANALWWVVALCALLVAASTAGAVVLATGTSGHTDTAGKTAGTAAPSPIRTTSPPSSTEPGTVPTTSVTTPVTTGGGFVQPQPSRAGVFCSEILADQKTVEETWTGLLGTGPDSNPWGKQKIALPAHPSATFTEDLAAVRSLENATSVVQQAWQENGYQYEDLTVNCLAGYDTHFQWLSNTGESTDPSQVSVYYTDRHSIIAAQSESGTCWYELNVMGPGDPVIAEDDLPSYGVYIATSDTNCDADTAATGALWQPADPLPPQLTG